MMAIMCGLLLATATNKVQAQPGGYVSFNVFYDNLSPYGDWIQDPAYGYVWVPRVGAGFQPYYTEGYWVMTDYGNTWVSNYPWGWAPFHYGRWTYDNYYGWVWIPDNTWGPAWVCWRSSPSYYGWAPLAPGFNISVSFNSYYAPNDWWVFIPPRYIHDHHFHNYYGGPRNNVTIINNTTIVNNVYVDNGHRYVEGPRRAEIQQTTHQQVQVYKVQNTNKPSRAVVDKNTVEVYRPNVSDKTKQAAPAKVVKEERAIGKPEPVSVNKGVPERNATIKQQPANGTINKNNRTAEPRKLTPATNQRAEPAKQQPTAKPDMNNNRAPANTQPRQVQPQRVEPTKPQPNRVVPNNTTPKQQMRTTPTERIPEQQRPQVQPNQQRVPTNAEPRQQQPRQMQPQRVEPARPQPSQQPRQMQPQRIEPARPQPRPQNMQRSAPPSQPRQMSPHKGG